jgi:exonuclease III
MEVSTHTHIVQCNLFKAYHQNIRGLKDISNELISFLFSELPHTICLTEYHLKDHEIDKISNEHYNLGAKFCRQFLKNGGVSIFGHKSLTFTNIPLEGNCKEQDIEVCAVKLNLSNTKIIIISIYRLPSGNFKYFLKKLDTILNTLHSNKEEFIICGDVNVNYLDNCSKRQQLGTLLSTYNLISTVNFPTRMANSSVTAIDNIFVNMSRNYTISPFINGLSDHDTQLINLKDVMLPKQACETQLIRKINNHTIAKFQLKSSYENWDEIFVEDDVNTLFNTFHNIYLRISLYSCFTKKKINSKQNNNSWMTKGIRISCKNKRDLYLKCGESSDTNVRLYYKRYCKILAEVIREAKKLHYNSIILKSKNKIKQHGRLSRRK